MLFFQWRMAWRRLVTRSAFAWKTSRNSIRLLDQKSWFLSLLSHCVSLSLSLYQKSLRINLNSSSHLISFKLNTNFHFLHPIGLTNYPTVRSDRLSTRSSRLLILPVIVSDFEILLPSIRIGILLDLIFSPLVSSPDFGFRYLNYVTFFLVR